LTRIKRIDTDFKKLKKTLELFDSIFFFQMTAKKEKYLLLAPIAVKILISRGSAYKIETESGTNTY
jgi:hypothetical protein